MPRAAGRALTQHAQWLAGYPATTSQSFRALSAVQGGISAADGDSNAAAADARMLWFSITGPGNDR